MSDAPAAADSASGGGLASKLPLLLALLNTVALLGALGVFAYTKLLFKRPAITEQSERERLAEIHASPLPAAQPALVDFAKVTINLSSPTPKQHYVTLAFAVELRDERWKGTLEMLKPHVMDRILSMLGKKLPSELTTVQGRYVLRTQILEHANELMAKEAKTREVFASNVYFSEFIVQ